MPKDIGELVKEHHAFYEVAPYYLVSPENPGKLPTKTQTIKAGFDVDIYGENTSKEPLLPGSDYARGYAEIRKLAEKISQHTSDSCVLEIIAFPERITLGGSSHTQPQGMLRIRISHHRGLNQPAGPAEERAVKELEAELQQLGVTRR